MQWQYVLLLAICVAGAVAEDVTWKKYQSSGGAFSFQYPEGWKVAENGAVVTITSGAPGEEIIVMRIPAQPGKDAAGYAALVAEHFKTAIPDFQITDVDSEKGKAAFRIAFSQQGLKLAGLGVVIEESSDALWISHSALSKGYSAKRGETLVAGVTRSMTTASSPKPEAAVPREPSVPSKKAIVGHWGSHSYYGDLVDPATGAYRSDASSGQWYIFREDGTYRYIIISSGRALSAMSVSDGTYEVKADRVILHQRTVSFRPLRSSSAGYSNKPDVKDEEYELEIQPEKLLLRELPNGNWFPFERQKQSP